MFKPQRKTVVGLISSASRRAIATAIALVLLNQPAWAAVYPVDMERKLNGLKIFDRISRLEVGNAAVLSLTNAGTAAAVCRVTFDSRIDQPRTSSRKIGPGETTTMHYSASRQINRLKIIINCKPL